MVDNSYLVQMFPSCGSDPLDDKTQKQVFQEVLEVGSLALVSPCNSS